MSARKQIARTTTNNVTKFIKGKMITLYCGDTLNQTKQQLYTAMKKIECGKLCFNPEYSVFELNNDGTLKGIIKIWK